MTDSRGIPLGEQFIQQQNKYAPEQLPLVTIVIPTCNCASLISLTLESILNQQYSSYEIIVIDCSTDRTAEVVREFRSEKIRLYSVEQNARYQMLNKGLSQAKGTYINFLFPGDFYLSIGTLQNMMALALDSDSPQLVYGGTLLRDGKSEAKILFRPLTIDLLKKGQQPTSLQACWFRTDAMRKIGKFNTHLTMRGGLELFCRFLTNKDFRFNALHRVFTDYDLRTVTMQMVMRHFWETLRIVYHYFGLVATLKWLLSQKDVNRFFRLWWRNLTFAFSGK